MSDSDRLPSEDVVIDEADEEIIQKCFVTDELGFYVYSLID